MGDWKTFVVKIKELLKSNNLSAAKDELAIGLEKFPNQVKLLIIATDVYRAFGDREKSLEYSELLITHYPDNWNGYGRAAQDLVALKRFVEAQEKVQTGLEKLPNQLNLLVIATDVYRAFGDREKSLEHAELLIIHYPEQWQGYLCAAHDKLSLGRFQPSEYQKQMAQCQPPSGKYNLRLWQCICNFKNTTKQKIWSYSFKKTPEPAECDEKIMLESWQPFQYWSQGSPPSDIEEITGVWNSIFESIGVRPIKLFDKSSALEYIDKNCPELSISFKTSFHYAVEADVFRVAYAQKNNCIWLDSDLYPKPGAKDSLRVLLSHQKTTLFFRAFRPWITNAFFVTPSASLFFVSILNSTMNIDFSVLPHSKETILQTFGPARYNQEFDNILNSGDQSNVAPLGAESWAARNFNFVNDHNFASMKPPFRLQYLSSSDRWKTAIADERK